MLSLRCKPRFHLLEKIFALRTRDMAWCFILERTSLCDRKKNLLVGCLQGYLSAGWKNWGWNTCYIWELEILFDMKMVEMLCIKSAIETFNFLVMKENQFFSSYRPDSDLIANNVFTLTLYVCLTNFCFPPPTPLFLFFLWQLAWSDKCLHSVTMQWTCADISAVFFYFFNALQLLVGARNLSPLCHASIILLWNRTTSPNVNLAVV